MYIVHSSFESAPLAQVVYEADKVSLALGFNGSNAKLHRKDRAVSTLSLDLPADTDDFGFSGAEVVLQVFIVVTAVWFGHQHADVSPEHFVGRVSKQRHRSWIERQDRACLIDRNDAVQGFVYERSQQRLA
jgi:hypothetical protein